MVRLFGEWVGGGSSILGRGEIGRKKEGKEGKPVTLGAMVRTVFFIVNRALNQVWHCDACRSHAQGLNKVIVSVDRFVLINRFLAYKQRFED